MIPADVAKSLQVAADAALRPVAPEQDLADRLAGLTAGDKVMAQIQAALPNGTYRALINQRVITLALPFAAKSGDALELLVTENNGKLALAVLSAPEGADSGEGGTGAGAAAFSARATLSRAGQLISTLYSEARDGGGKGAVALNGNQPIASTTPVSAQDLLPQLKQAITQSGMFYEAHQAEWIEGRFAKAALLQEPQGRLSSPEALRAAALAAGATDAFPIKAQAGSAPVDPDATSRPIGGALPGRETVPPGTAEAKDVVSASARLAGETAATSETAKPASAQTTGQLVAPQAQALVQQQLEALATQNFSWQGQIWPGQEMRWDIDEYRDDRVDENGARGAADDEPAARWSTRLRLTLPTLGEIDARIRLQGNQITLSMAAGEPETRDLMRASGSSLRRALDEAGIALTSLGVGELSNAKDMADAEDATNDGQETR
jgi:flagellar hook-length control protein FliK